MIQRLKTFISETNEAIAPQEIIKMLQVHTRTYGCEYLAFGPATKEAAKVMSDVDTDLPYITNFPCEWMERYREKNYIEIDPIVKYSASTNHAFTWKELKLDPNQSSKIRKFWQDADSHGLSCGITVPLHGPLSQSFLMSISSGKMEYCTACMNLEELQLVAYQFYLAYTNGKNNEDCDVYLTDRETEVLYWTAQGKSAWDISIILEISEHTVNFHLKNLTKKLDVTNKVAAAVKGVRLGLITL